MEHLKKITSVLLFSPLLTLLTLAAVAWGAYHAIVANLDKWQDPAAVILLAVLAGYFGLKGIQERNNKKENIVATWIAWIVLFGAMGFMYWSSVNDIRLVKNLALLFGAFSILLFNGGFYVLKDLGLSFATSLMVLPFFEQIVLTFSHPLREISTWLTVEIIAIFHPYNEVTGMGIMAEGTTITVDKTQIAITDACSGIDQLGVLFLFAYLILNRFMVANTLLYSCIILR